MNGCEFQRGRPMPDYNVLVSGVILAAGVAAIFGISFGLLPALLLLVGLSGTLLDID